MSEHDRPPSPRQRDIGRIHPIGWSPAAGTLVAAWVVAGAIAQLTGATAVVVLMAGTAVGFAFEIAGGWWAARSVRVRSITAPLVVGVDETCRLQVTLDAAGRRRPRAHQVSLRSAPGSSALLTPTRHLTAGPRGTMNVSFESPGIARAVIARVEVTGPAGLLWWARSATIDIDAVHVAPPAAGPPIEVEQTVAVSLGTVAVRRANHGGEIDGVRPWRRGDSTTSVHWASSLRSDELIVHDRLSSGEQNWVVELRNAVADGAVGAGRLRATLDDGRRRGHSVAVRTADGVVHRVADDEAAATWSAIAADTVGRDQPAGRAVSRRRTSLLQRQIRFRSPMIEVTTTISSTARWAAAIAAVVAMATLIGALGGSFSVLAAVVGAGALGAAVSLWVARRAGGRPVALQIAIVVAIVATLAAIAVRAADVDGLLAALRGPLPNVLMLLVILHGFEVVDRRTLRVHLAITLVIASYAAGLRLDAALGWWLAAWAVPFAVALAATGRCEFASSAPRAARRSSAADSMRAAGGSFVRLGAFGAATLAVLSMAPIPDGPARLGLPALSSNAPTVAAPGGLGAPDGSPSTPGGGDADRGSIGATVGYPGFTEALDTAVRGDLGDDIVMRVRAPEPAFWRGQTFSAFDGRTWTVSPVTGDRHDGPIIDVPPTVGDALGANVASSELVQTYFVEQNLPNVVFAATRPVRVIFDGSLWTRPDGALRSDVTLTRGSVYTVVSERMRVDADILRSQGDLGAFFAGFRDMAGGDDIDPFLTLADSTTQRTIDLATSLRTPGESTYDTILAYERWLGANTEYDLDAPVPPAGTDAVDDFLFGSRRGFCEQIASALTIMLRSQGVPARLATGYVSGERDRVSGVWNVRARDAHAWVEVWFPQTGWQAFDPTADVPLAADAGGGTIGGDLFGATVSSIASHRAEIAAATIALAIAWIGVRLAAIARYRTRRGRWGVLQDRYSRLGVPSATSAVAPTTNALIAATVDPAARAAARAIADELDRAAFDPSWTDDDDAYQVARSALTTLERAAR